MKFPSETFFSVISLFLFSSWLWILKKKEKLFPSCFENGTIFCFCWNRHDRWMHPYQYHTGVLPSLENSCTRQDLCNIHSLQKKTYTNLSYTFQFPLQPNKHKVCKVSKYQSNWNVAANYTVACFFLLKLPSKAANVWSKANRTKEIFLTCDKVLKFHFTYLQ